MEEYGYPNQVFVLPRKEQVVMETERLILREFVPEDFEPFFEIVSDPETMQHYPKPVDVEPAKLPGIRIWPVGCRAEGDGKANRRLRDYDAGH